VLLNDVILVKKGGREEGTKGGAKGGKQARVCAEMKAGRERREEDWE